MRRSLRFKITFVLVLSMTMMILLCWILNKTLLPYYYQNSKVKMLGSSFQEISMLFMEEGSYETAVLTEEQEDTITRIGSSQNVDIYILTKYAYHFFARSNHIRAKERIDYSRLSYVFGALPSYEITDIKLLYSNAQYNIYSQADKRQNSDYIDLYGVLDNQVEIFIRANYESIQEGAEVANRLLAYVGIAVAVIGSIVVFFISRSFTKPILKLADLSKKMAHLDFDAKYQAKGKDEIALLGSSMNELSEKLELTISELKSANNELQSDIQNKIQIDEMRKEFLSNVTHELKTPIALIQGYAEGLQDNINEDAGSRQFYCEVIIDEARRMNNMVKKLLTLNQLEFGTGQIEMERFDITALIRSVISSVDILIKQKKVRMIFEETEPVYVWADEYMIEEVITNYISNALNHVSGANMIEVKLIHYNGVVRVAVFNTGERIPEEDLENVWVKFYKVDKARTREYGGSGIGLSIVKAVMTSHHQNCGVVNHQNGVEFWCELDMHSNMG